MNLLGRIVLWVLFWYYLAPYYLFKKYVFKTRKYKTALSALWSVVVAFFIICGIGALSSSNDKSSSDTASAPKAHVVVKKVGAERLAKAKSKQKVLNEEEKKKQKEYKKLVAELDDLKEKKKKQEAEANKMQQEAEKPSSNSTATHHHPSSASGGTSRSDMNTAKSGKIVGNRNSKIYHVPGQAGYNMSSANAVYFNSEQEAISAGYRKAKR